MGICIYKYKPDAEPIEYQARLEHHLEPEEYLFEDMNLKALISMNFLTSRFLLLIVKGGQNPFILIDLEKH